MFCRHFTSFHCRHSVLSIKGHQHTSARIDLGCTEETSTDPGVDAIAGVFATAVAAWSKVRSDSAASDAASLAQLLADATPDEVDQWHEHMARALYNSEAGRQRAQRFH